MHPFRPWARGHAADLIGGSLLAFCFLWVGVGLWHAWTVPVIGWLPLPVMAVLAAMACRRVARHPGFDAGTHRFWSRFGLASIVLTAAITANAVDAVGGSSPSQRLGPVTLGLYLSVLAIALWALVRLPSWQRSSADWIRFGIDACVVLVTSGAFVWHFSLREHQVWMAQTGSAAAMLSIVVVACVSMATFAKVAFAGAGLLDRRALHILAVGTAISAVFGGMSPFLIDRPHLSTSLVAVSTAAYSIQLAAGRQLRGGAPRPPRRSRGVNQVPYVAVGATDALLLSTGTGDPTETTIMQAAVVLLTALVVTRQILVLRENQRLLSALDANLTQLRHYHDELAHQATHDALTGIGNRTRFEQETWRALEHHDAVHVLLFDLDDFKTVNDRLGHGTGDLLIGAVARRLDTLIGPHGSVARLGGDEFVVLLSDVTSAGLETLLRRVRSALQQPVQIDEYEITPHASIGITAGSPGDTPQELLRRAAVAMYAAKVAGGNRWTWFDPIMDRQADATTRLSADLRKAIANNELSLHFQPIVTLPDGAIAGVEALLRWRHPEHGPVAPDVFIPLAERTGFIVELGNWVFEQACRQAAAWNRDLGSRAPGRISINVSARQLGETGFLDTVADVLRHTGVDPRRLLIEVTETAVLSTGSAVEALTQLQSLGLQIALDDFGTGQSSLSLLLDCPVDVLKVDKSFVSGDAAEGNGAAIVEALIGFTQRLRIDAVAEGVETHQQAQRLHAVGYRYAQGYHFARPMSAQDLERALVAPCQTAEPGEPAVV